MNEINDREWTNFDRALADLLRASVDGVRLPTGFSARLAPALAARRRAQRARRFAATVVAVAFAAVVALLAGSAGRVWNASPGPPSLLAGDPRSDAPGTELAAGWTIAGLCRTLRRRRRDEERSDFDPDTLQHPTKTP